MANLALSACVAEIKANPGKYYVYVLSRPDGSPFYVGCGKVKPRGWQRIVFHESQAKDDKVTSHKCNAIRKIWSSGGAVGYQIESWHETEPAMFAREVDLISAIGRADLGTGSLTNWSAGGDGLVNRSQAVRLRASESMRARMDTDAGREWGRQSSIRIKAHWDSEEGRAVRLAAQDRPEAIAARRAASLRQNADADIIRRKSETMKLTWQTPEYQEKQNAAFRAAVSTPEYRAKKGAQASARWSDPAYKERLREAHRARWQLIKSK